MNTTTRTTRECSLDSLNPTLRAAMLDHAAQYNLGDLEADMVMCCETTSVHPKKGMFGSVETTISAVFLTPKWLIWADSTDQNHAGVGSAQLRQIDVRDYETTAMNAISPDLGLNITGRYTDRNKTGMSFIVLGSGPDGQKFRHVLKDAIKKVLTEHVPA